MKAAALAVLFWTGTALAQVAEPVAGLGESRWLDRAAVLTQLSARPREVLRDEQLGGVASLQVELGRLAFRSPQSLGGAARRLELTCDACHSGGHVNAGFFVPGLSSRPGTIDVTHRFFNPWRDDGLANPVAIPSLRGAAERERYGHEVRIASLREFIRHVMVDEFAADEPPPWLLDALTAYVGQLMPTDEAEAPVSLSADLADVDRFLSVASAAAAEEGDGERLAFVVGAIRFQLGRLHERFPGADGEAARQVLVGWSRALEQARTAADVEALRQRIAVERIALTSATRMSLYDRRMLRRRLGG